MDSHDRDGQPHIAIEAALHGQGVALGDSLLIGDDLAEGRLVRLFEKSVPASMRTNVVCRHETCDSPLVAGLPTDTEQVRSSELEA